MRITAVTLSYPPTRRIGAELAMHALLAHLAGRGHDVRVFTSHDAIPGTLDGVRVVGRLVSGRGIDTSHLMAGTERLITNAGIHQTIRRQGVTAPLFIWVHNNRMETLADLRVTADAVDVTHIANTHHMADVLLSVLGIRAAVLHPPVIAGTPGNHGDATTIINCSTDKGSDVFWDLARDNPDKPFMAVRGGWGKQDIRDLPNVTIIDHTDDLEPMWGKTRVLVLPSLSESYSMVAVEAASRGIPTVARDLPGVREALGDGALYVADEGWRDALTRAEHDWATLSRNAIAHHASIDTQGELDAIADLIEAGC